MLGTEEHKQERKLKMKIVADGKIYDLENKAYEVICEIDKFVVPNGLNCKSFVVRQLCMRKDGGFFILTIADLDKTSREKVQVWPVSDDDAARIAEGFVSADFYFEFFGKKD